MIIVFFSSSRPNLSVDSQPIKYGDEILISDINGQVKLHFIFFTFLFLLIF
jgi:hypothetical protein